MRRTAFVVLVAVVLALAGGVARAGAQTVRALEAGSAQTQDLSFWTTVSGSCSSSTVQTRVNSRSIKCDDWNSQVRVNGVLADAGRRISLYVYFGSVATGTIAEILAAGGDAGVGFDIGVDNDTLSLLWDGTHKKNAASPMTSGWHRISVSYVIATLTSWTANVWVDGVLAIAASNADFPLNNIGGTDLYLQNPTDPATSTPYYFSDLYIDDDTSLTDPGNINVTPKKPAALNTNSFDTLGGSGANRYDRVSDRPLSTTNFIQHAAATNVQENFGLQSAATGDVNLTGATLVGRCAWIWAKRGSLAGTVTFRTAHSANASSVAITTPASGDIILVAAYNAGSVTIPTLATGFTSLATQAPASSANAARLGWKTSNGTETTSGTWTNATRVVVLIYRGSNGLTVGTPVSSNGTGTALSYPALTLANTDGSSWVAGFGMAKAATAGMTGTTTALTSNRTSQTTVNGLDTNAGVASFAAQTLNVTTSGRWITWSIEVKATAVGAGTPQIMDNGTESAITLTTSGALLTKCSTSATYPSNAAGIGMRSSATDADTFFYEGGTLIAYTPAAGGGVTPNRLPLLGVRDAEPKDR